jgi:nicotinamide-nucleotide amidase
MRLTLNERMLAALEERHRRYDRPLPRRDDRLALLPQGATVWMTGDAEPGWMVDSSRGAFVVLPRGGGIEALIGEHLVPFLTARVAGRGAVVTRVLKTAGISVGDVEERLAAWLGKEGDVTVLVTPIDGEVWVRLRTRGATTAEAAEAIAPVQAELEAALGADCYGHDADLLEEVVGRRLAARHMTLSVAESCTGGLVGHRITSIPGSSAYFERGVVVYSNRAKMELLGVPEDVLRAHGAVSAPTAEAMARGVVERSGSACGLSITGVAGPDGGSPAKPVGTVFIGLAIGDDVTSQRFRFLGDRTSVKWQSSVMALDMLRRRLTSQP